MSTNPPEGRPLRGDQARRQPSEPTGKASGGERRRVARIYTHYASSDRKRSRWSASNPGNAAIRTELVDAVFGLAGSELMAAQTILDVGCGTGWWLERLDRDDRIGARLHGLELLPERVTAARARVPETAIDVGDVRNLPYGDATFDVVTLFTVLSSLAEAAECRRALAAARRVLAPGGVLLIWEPRIPNPFNPNTVFVSGSLLSEALRAMRVETRTTTVLPALSRRLGERTERLYPALARLGPLHTHRLVCAKRIQSVPVD